MDRHLLPEEIDQLLDGEVGFGTAPLKAHARSCPHCRAELEAARALVRQLERLPHFSPSPLFPQRVMSQVQVFVPWYVALADTIRGLVPQSRGVRWAAAAGFGTVAVALTIVSVWVITKLDSVIFAADMMLDRLRGAAMGALGETVVALFGEAALQAVRTSGGVGVVIAGALLLVLVLAATGALRVVAVRARGR